MKKCPYCKVEVGGDIIKCPLCQSKLSEESAESYFPKLEAQKARSFFYKLQLFIVWIILIVGIGLDFMIGLRLPGFEELHWSLLLGMWLVAFEFGFMRQFRPGTGPARKLTMIVLITLVLLPVTAYFLEFFEITTRLIIPIILTATIIANFVLAMIDKNGNTMAYLLSLLFLGVIPGIIIYLTLEKMPLAWSICLLVSAILTVGAVIFKGKSVAAEIRRRFNV